MNNGLERFKENFGNWNDVLRYMTEENTNLQNKVGKVLDSENVSLRPALERYKQRFDRQDQVILLLKQQLDEMIEQASRADDAGDIAADFREQLSNFKIDMDRVALLFSRLRSQFNRYVLEHLK